jgi:3-dehydroquinate synthase
MQNMVYRMPCNSARSYEVTIVENLLKQEDLYLLNLLNNRKALVVTTPTVFRLYGGALRLISERHDLSINVIVISCNETNKSLDLVGELCNKALQFELGRKDLLIALGGGICSDVVTVAASVIRRGIAHLRIPTTLIGQVDAGVGVKGSVNFRGKKSYLGCYYPPAAVLIDPGFLETLPQQHLRNGLAEIIKIAIVRDAELFGLIEANAETLAATGFQQPEEISRRVIWLAIKRMLQELESNLYEDQSFRRLVDMGHTFSPAIETASGFAIPHGMAVALDIALSSTLSVELGLLLRAEYERIISSITSAGLPVFSELITRELCLEALKESASHRGGAVNLVLPTKIGEATFLQSIDDLPVQTLDSAIDYLAKLS